MRVPDIRRFRGSRLCARLSQLLTVVFAISTIEPQVCFAKPREFLDPSFGSGGRASIRFRNGNGLAWALAAGPQGSLFVAGSAVDSPSSSQGVIAKYEQDGRLDNSFGARGIVLDEDLGDAQAIAIQPDGRVIVAGDYQDAGYPGEPDFAVERFNPDGSLDAAFGSGGKVLDSFVNKTNSSAITSIGLQRDGKILVGGSYVFQDKVGSSLITNGDFALARYNADGTVDTGFGNSGKVITDFKGAYDLLENFFVQPDEKIVAGGPVDLSGNPFDGVFGFARYNSDGSLDSAFGIGGRATMSVSLDYTGKFGLALAADGKIVAGGPSTDGPNLIRLNPDGTPDASFGQGGHISPAKIAPAQLFAEIMAISLQPDGKILASGLDNSSGPAAVFVTEYNQDGSIDTSIGDPGILSARFFRWTGFISSVIFQPDGKILAGGFAGTRLAIARYVVAIK